MAKKKDSSLPYITEGGSVTTVFGKETSFHGVLEFDKPLLINGFFEGEIKTEGILLIGEDAVVKADIHAGTVIVGGEVTGNILASKKLEMTSTGRVIGNIKTAKLHIADGVVFDGNCEMINPGQDSSSKAS
ncbi:MAG: polymer-forming cytoskeletal protein [Spirochaetia bacterium]|nr:polymer-forming cytoskeletal protein [Spirochaetia bacterium]